MTSAGQSCSRSTWMAVRLWSTQAPPTPSSLPGPMRRRRSPTTRYSVLQRALPFQSTVSAPSPSTSGLASPSDTASSSQTSRTLSWEWTSFSTTNWPSIPSTTGYSALTRSAPWQPKQDQSPASPQLYTSGGSLPTCGTSSQASQMPQPRACLPSLNTPSSMTSPSTRGLAQPLASPAACLVPS